MQGVGKETDIGYLTKDEIIIINQENINILDELYNTELNYGKKNKKLLNLNL